jgi:hypothetical protein
MALSKDILLHTHIYQPPRTVSHHLFKDIHTDPEHRDWTAIIDRECYQPLAEKGIFELISFDINGVLLAELERLNSPSLKKLTQNSRDNMVGTSYIHPILPDLSDSEKRIVIGAGLKRFQKDHHGHKPSVFWPPETAMDTKTAAILTEFDYKAFMCAPWQIKLPDGRPADNIPVRLNLPNGKSIIAIPFDRSYSAGLGFHDKSNAYTFVDHLVTPSFNDVPGQQLIGATDGETFGHHWKFGDHFLESLLKHALPSRGFRPIHSGQVDITDLPEAQLVERSAWSCHCGDLKRWSNHCACTGPDNSWKSNYYHTFKQLTAGIEKIARQELGGNYVNSMINHFETGFQNPGPSRSTPKESVLSAYVMALVGRTSCATFFDNPHTSGLINLLFGLVAIQHLKDAGLNRPGAKLEAEYMANLNRVTDPKHHQKTAKHMLENMLHQRHFSQLAPATLGLAR